MAQNGAQVIFVMKKNYIIGLGGSVIHKKSGIDTDFLKKFCRFIYKETKKGNRFLIVCGGGILARKFQAALPKAKNISNKDKDWLGIYCTRLNAQFLRIIFKKEAHPEILDERKKIKSFGRRKIIVGAGWEPGWSTDFVAFQVAADFGVSDVILASDVDFVYDKDPKKFKGARPMKMMRWKDYLKMIPKKWVPGMHIPIDPVAAKFASKNNLKVYAIFGRNIRNLSRVLSGKSFVGTEIVGG